MPSESLSSKEETLLLNLLKIYNDLSLRTDPSKLLEALTIRSEKDLSNLQLNIQSIVQKIRNMNHIDFENILSKSNLRQQFQSTASRHDILTNLIDFLMLILSSLGLKEKITNTSLVIAPVNSLLCLLETGSFILSANNPSSDITQISNEIPTTHSVKTEDNSQKKRLKR